MKSQSKANPIEFQGIRFTEEMTTCLREWLCPALNIGSPLINSDIQLIRNIQSYFHELWADDEIKDGEAKSFLIGLHFLLNRVTDLAACKQSPQASFKEKGGEE